MKVSVFTQDISKYLKCDTVINFDHPSVSELADQLYGKSENETDFIRRAYEYVRDRISHSADAGEDAVTCSASEVLAAGHGICFAKSHLLAAILRGKSVPTGFCYQKLILDDETAPVLIYHGLNGVFVSEYEKWIRLDARGNKSGVDRNAIHQNGIAPAELFIVIRVAHSRETVFIQNFTKRLRRTDVIGPFDMVDPQSDLHDSFPPSPLSFS